MNTVKAMADRRHLLISLLLASFFVSACGSHEEKLYGHWKAEGPDRYEIKFRKHDVRVVQTLMGMHIGDNTYDAVYEASNGIVKVKNVGDFQIVNDDKILMIGQSRNTVFRRQ